MWPNLIHHGFTFAGYLQAYVNYFKFRAYVREREGDADAQVDVYLVNDVTYFSYQHVTPPNLHLVGGIYLSPRPDPLDSEYSRYTASRNVVYVSFGSYAIPDWLPWFQTLLEALELSEATFVIIKINRDRAGNVLEGSKKVPCFGELQKSPVFWWVLKKSDLRTSF